MPLLMSCLFLSLYFLHIYHGLSIFTFLSHIWLCTNSNNAKQWSLPKNKNSRKDTTSFIVGLCIVIVPCAKINSAVLSQATGNKQKERENVMITMITESTHTLTGTAGLLLLCIKLSQSHEKGNFRCLWGKLWGCAILWIQAVRTQKNEWMLNNTDPLIYTLSFQQCIMHTILNVCYKAY